MRNLRPTVAVFLKGGIKICQKDVINTIRFLNSFEIQHAHAAPAKFIRAAPTRFQSSCCAATTQTAGEKQLEDTWTNEWKNE